MKETIKTALQESASILETILSDEEFIANVATISETCVQALKRSNKILLAGNGGSAADAQHIAGEFVSRFNYDRPGLPAIALTTDTSIMTAIGNDYGYEKLFTRQVQALGREGDVFFGITTSGSSPNILAAFEQARSMGLVTVAFTGQTADLADLVDFRVNVPSKSTPKIQEVHITVGHIICGLVEAAIFPRTA